MSSILERVDASWRDALLRALDKEGIDRAREHEFKLTHDGRLVYPADAELPKGASGFAQCQLQGYTRPGSGSYGTWLEPEDQMWSRFDSERLERLAKTFHTKAVAERMLRAIGCECPEAKLRDMRVQYQVRRMAQLWPLRENLGRVKP
jgi:hypothetical protein